MNTQHFKYAVEVAKTGSITQAADNLFMAQPNLSKAIKELEDTLGIVIFKRTSKGVVPTPKGAAFLEYAKKALAQIREMELLRDGLEEGRQHFSISIPRGSYIAKGCVDFIETLDKGQGMEVNLKETNSLEAIQNIVEGPYNMGIIRFAAEDESYFLNYLKEKGLRYEFIWEFTYVLLLSKFHALVSASQLYKKDLEDYIEILHGDTGVPYIVSSEPRRQKGPEGIKRQIFVYERASQFELLQRIPETYMWVSPVPAQLTEQFGLVQRRCVDANKQYRDLLIYSKDYKLTNQDKRFIDKLFAAKNEVAFQEIQ